MKKTISLLLALCALLVSCASSPQNAPVGDNADSDGEIRIVATSSAICEILDKLNIDSDFVVGVPDSSSLPERYGEITRVGSPMNPDLEIIKSLSPDLVLSPQSLESSLAEGYRSAGINSAFLDLSSVDGMYTAIVSLGEYLGCSERALTLRSEYEDYMNNYRSENDSSPSVLILMAFPDGFYLVATENSYVGSLVRLAGGENVYPAGTKGDENGFVSINPEDIASREADIILVFAHYAEEDAFAYMKEELSVSASWQHFKAIKEGRVAYLPSKYFGMSATFAWTDALEYLAPILHGEAK